MIQRIRIGEREFTVQIEGDSILLDGAPVAADLRWAGPNRLSLVFGGLSRTFTIETDAAAPEEILLTRRGAMARAQVIDPRRQRRGPAAGPAGRQRLIAPMAGRVIRCLVEVGAEVSQGQGILVLEAMKMQNEVRAPKSGRVLKLGVAPGAAVSPGDLLAEIE